MCERDSSDDILRGNDLSRRQFGALGLGATLGAMLPAVATAAEVSESDVEIKTPDGVCDAHFVQPAKATAAGMDGACGADLRLDCDPAHLAAGQGPGSHHDYRLR
jgi:hypothetical protein